jgi:hypothetical protein
MLPSWLYGLCSSWYWFAVVLWGRDQLRQHVWFLCLAIFCCTGSKKLLHSQIAEQTRRTQLLIVLVKEIHTLATGDAKHFQEALKAKLRMEYPQS